MTNDRQNFADTLLTCEECGVEFIWTVTQQRRLVQQGASLQPPTHCPTCQRVAPLHGSSRGRVKWYNRTKGWGFITTTSGEELFVHRTGLGPRVVSLQEGDLVEFSVEQTPKGPQAVEVRPLALQTAPDLDPARTD